MFDLFSACTVKLTFEFGRIESRHMNLSIIHNSRTSYLLEPIFNDNVGSAVLTLNITLPTVFDFVVSNKGPLDTLVDSNGNIIQDCYIKLISLSLDGFVVTQDMLRNKISLVTDNGQVLLSNYFGFNGVATLNLSKPDVFSQVLMLNRYPN